MSFKLISLFIGIFKTGKYILRKHNKDLLYVAHLEDNELNNILHITNGLQEYELNNAGNIPPIL